MRYSSDPKTNQRLLLISVGLSAVILIVVLLVYFKPTPKVETPLPPRVNTTTPAVAPIPKEVVDHYKVTSVSSTAPIPHSVIKNYKTVKTPPPIPEDVFKHYYVNP